jgi:hypothetical protein
VVDAVERVQEAAREAAERAFGSVRAGERRREEEGERREQNAR